MPDAMQGLATGNRGLKLTDREQTILTPQPIIDAVLHVWPEGIACDPCSAPGSLVPAIVRHEEADDGITSPWGETNYVNPPYADLKPWLLLAGAYWYSRGMESIVLCPIRMRRKWFRHAWKMCSARAALDGVRFVGYKQDFPENLCLLYWGSREGRFEEAVCNIGEIL